jgi:hypothetical protein
MITKAWVPAVSLSLLGLGALGTDEVVSPRLIMFHGQSLAEAKFATQHTDIGVLLDTGVGRSVSASDREDRPFITTTLFWHNPTWEVYAQNPEMLKKLKPEDAARTCALYTCTGRYYPAYRGLPAALWYDVGRGAPLPRTLGAEGLEVARRIGLPLVVE